MRQFFLTTAAGYTQANTIPADPGIAQLDILVDSPVLVRMQYGAFGQAVTFGEFELTQSSSFPGASGVAVRDSQLAGAATGVSVNVNAWYQNDPKPTLIPAGASNIVPVTLPAGLIFGYGGGTAPAGYVLCDGSTYDGTLDTYLALWQAIGTTYGGTGQSSFIVPDLRGRTLVGLGTHASVNALNDNDGVALANRSPSHNSTVTDPGHGHTVIYTSASGGALTRIERNPAASAAANTQTTNTNTTGVTVGPGGTLPVDTPAFLVANYIISLG